MEASPSPVYGARLLSGFGLIPIASSNLAASANTKGPSTSVVGPFVSPGGIGLPRSRVLTVDMATKFDSSENVHAFLDEVPAWPRPARACRSRRPGALSQDGHRVRGPNHQGTRRHGCLPTRLLSGAVDPGVDAPPCQRPRAGPQHGMTWRVAAQVRALPDCRGWLGSLRLLASSGRGGP